MPELHLISHILCPYVQRSVIVLLEKGTPFIRTDIDLANKPEWFLKVSPTGKVPLLLVDNKEPVFESSVICEYLDEITPGSLHPDNELERAKHRGWIIYASNILDNIAGLYNAPDQAGFNRYKQALISQFFRVESSITAGPFFSGTAFRMVDAVYAPVFRYFDLLEQLDALYFLPNYHQIRNWRLHLKRRQSVQAAVAENFPQLLREFLVNRKSYLSNLLLENQVA